MRKKTWVSASTVAILALAFASVAHVTLAHGNEKHVVGTVTAITDTEITVQSQVGQSQVVKIAPDTSFVKSGAASSLKELKVGDRVVIHAKPVGNDLVAHEVRFGKAPTSGGSSGSH
jgi:Domain of unknown function (DUF5666)